MRKKLISSIIFFASLLLMISTAFAAPSPHMAGHECPDCIGGLVTGYKYTETYNPLPTVHDEPVEHLDWSYLRVTYYREDCDSCSYYEEDVISTEWVDNECPYK